MGYMYPIQHVFNFTFKVGKTQFRGLSLLPLSRNYYYQNKKKWESFHFEAVSWSKYIIKITTMLIHVIFFRSNFVNNMSKLSSCKQELGERTRTLCAMYMLVCISLFVYVTVRVYYVLSMCPAEAAGWPSCPLPCPPRVRPSVLCPPFLSPSILMSLSFSFVPPPLFQVKSHLPPWSMDTF